MRAFVCATWLAMCGGTAAAADLSFETVLAAVSGCQLDMAHYRGLWTREEALLLSLPAGGAVRGIVISQFYMAPGRNGSEGDYGVVLNAPLAQVIARLPDLASPAAINGRQRRLLPLADATGDPRHRGQTLLVCRGGADI